MEKEQIVNPYEIPDPSIDWALTARKNDLGFEYSVCIDEDGGINASVHLSARLLVSDTMELLGHTINSVVAERPDGYYFTDALIDHEALHLYFSWTNQEVMV